jgi:hypothetical protein
LQVCAWQNTAARVYVQFSAYFVGFMHSLPALRRIGSLDMIF